MRSPPSRHRDDRSSPRPSCPTPSASRGPADPTPAP
jgi:hypothetical protein